MYCDLGALARDHTRPRNLTIEVVEDYDIFAAFAHPYFGDVQTPLRRFELARLAHLNQMRPRRVWDLVALRDGVPVGACTLFFDGTVVGFHDVGVLPSARGQGIGTALVRRACEVARRRGALGAVLIASTEGFSVYERSGFTEVGRIAYWYRRYGAA